MPVLGTINNPNSKPNKRKPKKDLIIPTGNTFTTANGTFTLSQSAGATATAGPMSTPATDIYGLSRPSKEWDEDPNKGKKDKPGPAIKLPPDVKLPAPILYPTTKYKWNLPPHTWSLPVEPASVNSTTSKYAGDSNNLHSSRRGKIFYCAGFTGTQVKADANKPNRLTTSAKSKFSYYGFQFMWNPETFSQSTRVNMELTYDASDPYAALTSLVAANATVSFTLRLDRTNDFACFRDTYHSRKTDELEYYDAVRESMNMPNASVAKLLKAGAPVAGGSILPEAEWAPYYSVGQPANSKADFDDNMQDKLQNLMRFGTMADIEYLFRAINGDGFKPIGIETSNIGYLMPTIVRLDLGPQKWVGIINDITINHLSFTQGMIPIRSDVTLTLDVRATTNQLSTAPSPVVTTPPPATTTP